MSGHRRVSASWNNRTGGRRLQFVLWLIPIVAYLIYGLVHLSACAWDHDEGLYLQRAALANAGHSLYTEILLNKPPLLVWLLQVAFWLGGASVETGRLIVLLLNLAGMVALTVFAWGLWGERAGVAAAWLCLGLPEFIERSAVIVADLPAASLASVSLAAALLHRRGHHRYTWLVLSGFTYAAAVLIHPLVVYTALPLGVVLLSRRPLLSITWCDGGRVRECRAGWREMAFLVAVISGSCLLTLIPVDAAAYAEWVIATNASGLATGVLERIGHNWEYVRDYLMDQPAILGLAVVNSAMAGATVDGRRRWGVVYAWFFGACATLLVTSPIWLHYLLLLALPVVIVASGGVAQVATWLIDSSRSGREWSQWQRALAILVAGNVLLFGIQGTQNVTSTLDATTRTWTDEARKIQRVLLREAPAGGYVVSDDPFLAFATGRWVVPALTEASFKSIRAGLVTSGDLVGDILTYQPALVVLGDGRLGELDGFEEWVSVVAERRSEVGETRVYQMAYSEDAAFDLTDGPSWVGSGITLRDVAISDTEIEPGDTISVTLMWMRMGPVLGDPHVFVHLLGDDGELVAQHDGTPVMGLLSAADWPQGVMVPDPHVLTVPEDVPLGRHQLVAGMYNWPDLLRLPALSVKGQRWPNDAIELGDIVVCAGTGENRFGYPGLGAWAALGAFAVPVLASCS
ncbi:MAG: hypothetical protein GX620_10040 [Chloroflexi bacterium]|nr:hypothetical protein [Chloroflexota bacterium]